MNFTRFPHRRYNILTGDWVLVSSHRTDRPWQGKIEKTAAQKSLPYDPGCYLCPGNERASGAKNPQYEKTFVFVNDYPALLPEGSEESMNNNSLLVAESEKGLCKVLCYSPRHDLTLPLMEQGQIANVVAMWIDQYREIGSSPGIGSVQIFENRGALMGCSNAHPHGQIWADEKIPPVLSRECERQSVYLKEKKSCLLCDYANLELKERERIVIENRSFTALVPFWAVWPYETMIIPKNHRGSIDELKTDEQADLADILKRLQTRYDNLFLTGFPFSMGIHQKPTDNLVHPEWHFHFHFYPPLLRSATVQKFMVGYELLSMPQRDLTAETAAERLRGLSDVHYSIQ
jgi:UDPglucose--hexose-1-phosphate uridylyltransferase